MRNNDNRNNDPRLFGHQQNADYPSLLYKLIMHTSLAMTALFGFFFLYSFTLKNSFKTGLLYLCLTNLAAFYKAKNLYERALRAEQRQQMQPGMRLT